MATYPITDDKYLQIENAFTYHRPFGEQPEKYEKIRGLAREVALLMVNLCPPSRELSLALTNLEQSVMWANAAIARNETEGVDNG